MSEKKRIAALISEYRPHSHADVIIGRLLEGGRRIETPHLHIACQVN